MKILAVIGSPRNNGNTYEAVKLIEDELNIKNPGIEFEYVQLGSANLKPCKGCFTCIERGEEKCPLKDGRETLEFKMQQADGVIFASPVYTYNVSWIRKTEMFYERLLDTKPEKPSFIKLLQFVKQKRAYSKAPKDLADFKFWRDKGWLAETTDYYYEVRAGKMIKLLVYIISKLTRCAG